MELIIKACAAGLISAIISLIIKRSNPEISVTLSCCCVTFILLCAMSFAAGIRELMELAVSLGGTAGEYLMPVLKCLGISIATRFAAELCRDASQNAVSASIELAGALCALGVSMPLLLSVLKMLGGLI